MQSQPRSTGFNKMHGLLRNLLFFFPLASHSANITHTTRIIVNGYLAHSLSGIICAYLSRMGAFKASLSFRFST